MAQPMQALHLITLTQEDCKCTVHLTFMASIKLRKTCMKLFSGVGKDKSVCVCVRVECYCSPFNDWYA